jgi:hypothetical protein
MRKGTQIAIAPQIAMLTMTTQIHDKQDNVNLSIGTFIY